MSFVAGRLEGLEVVASEGIFLSYASQVMSWKVLSLMPAHGMPVSARFCVDLGCLMLGHSICALITSNASMRLDFK